MASTSILAQSYATFALIYHLQGKYGNHQDPTITARLKEVWYISRLVFVMHDPSTHHTAGPQGVNNRHHFHGPSANVRGLNTYHKHAISWRQSLSIIKREWYMLLKWKSGQPNPVILCASVMQHRFTLPSASQLARSYTRKSAEVTVPFISNSKISQLSLCFHTHKPLTII